MYNCIFSGHCFEYCQCDKSCPALAQTSYLLERNGISMNSDVFKCKPEALQKYISILQKCKGKVASVIDTSTMQVADILTYCGICETWKGSQLHCTTYNLRFSKYIDAVQKSWNYSPSEPSEAEYMKIWANGAKILIISNIDYVNFKDFQCQTLLSLMQSRANSDLTTIIVLPPVKSLVGEGQFFAKLTDIISKQKVE